MKYQLTRRDALKIAMAGVATSAIGCTNQESDKLLATGPSNPTKLTKAKSSQWHKNHDRIFIGGEYWANPMENWCIKNGAAECVSTGGNRSIHSLVHQITDVTASFKTSVIVEKYHQGELDGGAGLRIGAKSDINEYKSNCFVQQGIDAGIIDGQLVLGKKRVHLNTPLKLNSAKIVLSGVPTNGIYALTAQAFDSNNQLLAELTDYYPASEVSGNIAVVSNFTLASEQTGPDNGSKFRFSDWQFEGNAICDIPDQKFGPILWSMYTLNDSRSDKGYILKLSALTGPLGKQDNHSLQLEVEKNGQWQQVAQAELDKDAWVATFVVENWQANSDFNYRVIYQESLTDNSQNTDTFSGIIKANPTERNLRMAALTCQNDYGFPYAPVAENVVKMNPDLVYFSGDQIYENHGGFGVIYAPADLAILNYLRKYYQFGWAFREAMRNAPTVVLPDDHDILQGNLWGEGGNAMSDEAVASGRTDNAGGYISPVKLVNVVHKTHTGHHPDPVDPTPSARNISVYYTELVYGNVSFAIIADRQWKSGPETLNIDVGVTGNDEAPNYFNPDFDGEGLDLLGKRQEAFLEKWADDWRGHSLKAMLSQTVFAGISTHQPLPDRYLKYDFDSSGWPASARNRAIEIMRKSKALHICGDTHLGTLSQYGVNEQRDSNWAFCTPAISAGWPRWWRPDAMGLPMKNRPSHGLEQTGEYLDSFGNKIYVYAVANPQVGKSGNRYIQAHEKGSGFGFIEFDTQNKTYTTSAYKFLVDVSNNNADNQFPGWPVTIAQDENIGINKIG
ncbi:twin-arginine translocation pathway signal protein [Catenovulum agarivorans DS-2]|uniref:Twin-arginine translocation pathway signal protein n=1 Tax=Catenovulum agarivorans DS-2 TaxID=1328313 RepID=W7QCW6_9ALTE|nr:alkaline phosphatase D family protein [Catenovulum agarivorans]EWH10734.1 twin-arginine translocation pathway signal protein [Catenovulum agarivorans DS-2]